MFSFASTHIDTITFYKRLPVEHRLKSNKKYSKIMTKSCKCCSKSCKCYPNWTKNYYLYFMRKNCDFT